MPYSGYFAAKGKKNPKGKSCPVYKNCTVFRECWSQKQSAKSTSQLKEGVSVDRHRRGEHIPFTERGQSVFLPHRKDFTAQWRVQRLPPVQVLAWCLPAHRLWWGGSRVSPVKKRGAQIGTRSCSGFSVAQMYREVPLSCHGLERSLWKGAVQTIRLLRALSRLLEHQ